ncbi:UDP-glucose--hexose-1-phosphate uridylyltransferase [Neobacillus massiliamazoniensis]|uniref:Galactose-1-phosphate uridylyltransferase n=1 Tax=Neobacillus massiliamazoniensis TaxID=1499688 RepID=A0A0U1NTE0_9BACI|nr:UDP-glucose--hexose-1-phosphate uridylyltransferase [Neobacillus massiliamazoniensis]CRK81304.1 galactose-1-phosphate uridylyltransferase [Neobacillus massiliamazoniensis]
MDVYVTVNQLVHKAVSLGLIQPDDEIYARNQIMALLDLTDFPERQAIDHEQAVGQGKDIPDLLDELTLFAVQTGLIEDLLDEREILSSKMMNIFMPKPSEVNKTFYEKWAVKPENATNFFYELSKNSQYIQTKRVQKNIQYKTDTPYGEIDITINLSKPEKDPKEIAREREMKASSANYPKCLLCSENEGYAGRIGHPARSNHRIIKLELTGESWFFQYSPYVYYHEHCIVLSHEHRDMVINREAFQRLIEFVEKFPHYFIGSNADLPIVGGSILSHDHYQGGNYEFAMAKAQDEMIFTLESFPTIKAATIKWPMSVIRLRGKDKEALVAASDFILVKWKKYTDIDANIFAFTGKTRHNTITPIVRIREDAYEVDLVLRNNRTDELHPLGIFHPHGDVHHIKKENIGLIEVMGLAVLPPRLKTELIEVENYLLDLPNQVEDYHLPWAQEMKIRYHNQLTAESVTEIVQKEVGLKFLRALENAGVYKRTEEGQKAFQKFITSLGSTSFGA